MKEGMEKRKGGRDKMVGGRAPLVLVGEDGQDEVELIDGEGDMF